jgi:hypothetical protein
VSLPPHCSLSGCWRSTLLLRRVFNTCCVHRSRGLLLPYQDARFSMHSLSCLLLVLYMYCCCCLQTISSALQASQQAASVLLCLSLLTCRCSTPAACT